MEDGGGWRHFDHVVDTTVALVNSGPPSLIHEALGDTPHLNDFVKGRVISEVETPSQADIEPVHRVRAQLRAVFVAPDESSRIELVNRLLSTARVEPRLSSHDALGLHLHYFPPYARLADHLLADCTMALALMLVSGEADRLRVCQAPDCSRVLIDRSRNRSRIFCDSGRCANRVNAAAYRRRQRTLAGESLD